MNTKYLMVLSALWMSVIGVYMLFMPQEILHYLNIPANTLISICLQVMGSLYFGFAILNWMAKTVLIGGIYSRPVAIGNLSHFMIGSITLIKVASHEPSLKILWIFVALYVVFAIGFGMVAFIGPSNKFKQQ